MFVLGCRRVAFISRFRYKEVLFAHADVLVFQRNTVYSGDRKQKEVMSDERNRIER